MAKLPDGFRTGPEGLAVCVLALAVADARSKKAGQMRDSARRWLTAGESVPFWSMIAGVDHHRLRGQLVRAGVIETDER
jgi:hypothetical protein